MSGAIGDIQSQINQQDIYDQYLQQIDLTQQIDSQQIDAVDPSNLESTNQGF